MAEKIYQDLDILIERAGDGYKARVLRSPAGGGQLNFAAPFSKIEVENLVLRVGRPRSGMRRIESPDLEAIKGFGGKLYAAVFDGEVGACLRSSMDETNRQGQGLRLRLQFSDVPDLVNLPWEYLYNPSLNRFLALSASTPVLRYLELPEPVKPLEVTPPLRILAMISSPSDFPELDVEKEWSNLQDALAPLVSSGRVVVDRVESATLSALLPRLRQNEYNIFHFIGHGGFDQQAQDGLLMLVDEKGRGRAVSGQELGTLLHDESSLRLAVLNACEGGRAASNDPFAGVAQSLVQQRIPAVIAMQFEVSDQAAIAFSRGFYSALADGFPVDAALSEGRKAIFALGNELEWGTPVLYTCLPDGNLFKIQPLPAGAAPAPVVPAAVAHPAVAAPAGVVSSPARGVAAPPLQPAGAAAPPKRPLPLGALIGGGIVLLVLLGFGLSSLLGGKETPTPVPTTALAQVLATGVPTKEEIIVLPPSHTPAPTDTPTHTPEPSATATPTSTDTPIPATPTITPTYAPGADILNNCLSVKNWTPYPEVFLNRGDCWDLNDRGFYLTKGRLWLGFLEGDSPAGDGLARGVAFELAGNTDIVLTLMINQLQASHMGDLMIGIVPRLPASLNDKTLLLLQNEGVGQPIVVKANGDYVSSGSSRYLVFKPGVYHDVRIRLENRTVSIFLDDVQVAKQVRLLSASKYYFWVGYSLNGRSGTLKLDAFLNDWDVQLR